MKLFASFLRCRGRDRLAGVARAAALLPVFLSIPMMSHASEKRPFPQHTTYTEDAIRPSGSQQSLDDAVTAFHRVWKQKYLRPGAEGELYVFANLENGFDAPDTRSVSEGQGYGMIITVLMAGADPAARADFDALYRFFRAHPSRANPDLMAWRQVFKGGALKAGKAEENPDDRNSATDGDLDIAFSLLLADRQWGSDGAIHYKAEGLKVLTAILEAESDPTRRTLLLGNWVKPEGKYGGSLRPSDLMPGHLKAFAEATGDLRWKEITDRSYEIVINLAARYSPKAGLVPDFAVLKKGKYAPAPSGFLEGKNDGAYSYNACRVPWRIATDYLLTGDPRALQLLEPLNRWVRASTEGDPARLTAGYRLDGRPLNKDRNAAFTAPFAVAAMTDPAAQAWLDALWNDLVQSNPDDEAYYGNTLKLLALIVLSGNWWQ